MNPQIEFPQHYPDYSDKQYWNSRYSQQTEPFEWLLSFSALSSILIPRLHQDIQSQILNVGCGNSPFSQQLFNSGFKNITNIDFSQIVIQQMMEKYTAFDQMDFACVDCCDLDYPASCFDLVFDKCTLDCVLCGQNSFGRANKMIQNIYRVLKPGGAYVCVSYNLPEARIGYLNNQYLNWTVQHSKISKVHLEEFTGLQASDFHYIYICTKSIRESQ